MNADAIAPWMFSGQAVFGCQVISAELLSIYVNDHGQYT